MKPTLRRPRPRVGAAALILTATTSLLLTSATAPASATGLVLPNPGSSIDDPWELQTVARAASEVVGHVAPGMSIAIVKRNPSKPDEAITTTYHFGMADKENKRRVGPLTQFEIASETKTFTAALLAKRVTGGQAQLEDLAQDYEDDVTFPTMDGSAITLGDLVTHRSGLGDDPGNLDAGCPGGGAHQCKDAMALYNRTLLWEGLEAPGALVNTPGSTWLYSDFAFGTLGTLLADAFEPGQTEPPFAQVVQRELTDPLGMTSTVIETQTPNLARPYRKGAPADFWNNTGALAGGGGLISTVSDMAKWIAATLGYGDGPLVPVLQSMLNPIPGATWSQAPQMQMGMAWQLYPPQNGISYPYAYKNGAAAGSTSATYLLPSEGWGVTVFANGNDKRPDGQDNPATDRLAFELMRELAPGYPGPETGTSLSSGSTGS
ncbi:class A beta-lactamase-related serine hydrolase [Rhodococcus sp. ABRD24]|uniref:serine hydrolase domain-containing protein n=1 Tax=Rhodococcus sp. ABRD24 TaxID=2507582 RepID=UPI00103FFCE0|nr:serine hydrolase domain-containing protein [Rhodococcus sp. ABRD24]QBJ95017.1 class A beta-lactamase-related serine hydrolase [Rhodococcus sp. ABRD24]